MKQYNIYKTTSLINGKYYWGVHDSIDENDGYLGSGVALRKAIRKHGKENFKRETKLLYDTAKEAYEDEARIVNKSMISDYMCYNLLTGGLGGCEHSEESKRKIGAALKGFKHSDEIKRKMSEAHKGKETWMKGRRHSEASRSKMSIAKKGTNNPNFGKVKSKETRCKISDSLKGENNPNYGKSTWMKGNIHSEESKKKMSKSHTGVKFSDERKQKMRKPRSEEHKRNISKARMGMKLPEKTIQKMRNRQLSEETRRKISIAATGRKHSEETKEKLRIAAKRQWIEKKT